jgi:hypothetical protein
MALISGTVAKVTSQDGTIDGFHQATPSDASYHKYLNIKSSECYTLSTGAEVIGGIAVEENPKEKTTVSVDSDIQLQTEEVVRTSWTRYWLQPDEFVVVQNKGGTFAFDAIEDAIDGEVEEVEFDLAQIVRDYPGQWMGGFENRDGNVENGTVYGENIEYDGDIGDAFLDSDKNQIGPRITYDNIDHKVRVGPSFFQISKPADYTRKQHLEFLDGFMKHYIK